jgi:hypothetical protein
MGLKKETKKTREKVGNIDIETAQKLIKDYCCFFNVVGSSCPFYPDNGCFAYDEEDISRKPCLHFGICIYTLMIDDRKVRNEFIKSLLKKCEERKQKPLVKKEKKTNDKKENSENKRNKKNRKGRGKIVRNNRTSKNSKSNRRNSKRLSSDTSVNRKRSRRSSK